MPRVDLEQALKVGVVVGPRELVRDRRSRGRVDAPGEAVGDDDGVEPLLAELLEEQRGGAGVLAAVRRERPA